MPGERAASVYLSVTPGGSRPMSSAVLPPPMTTSQDSARPEAPEPLRAVHTTNFPALLRHLGASLLVTTYQAGKLVMVRDEGDHLNTHFRAFQSPMGLALADGGSKLAIGTTLQVWEFRDNHDVARRLEPAGRHDACFLPRSSHVTGNVLIHEMAYGAGSELGRFSKPSHELWIVNTRFSCLATLDPESRFVPRWRPGFVTELAYQRGKVRRVGSAQGARVFHLGSNRVRHRVDGSLECSHEAPWK